MSEFWFDCRLSVSVQGTGEFQFEIDQPYALIGSSPDCDIVLDDPSVPARCFFLCAFGDRLVGASLCKVPGKFRKLIPGKGIRIGKYLVRVDSVGAETTETNQYDQMSELDPKVSWTQEGRKKFVQLKDQKPVLLGRKPPSHLTIADELLSSVHACIIPSASRLWVVDLASTNGTYVLDKQIRSAALSHRESFVSGATKFRFRTGSDEPAVSNDNARLQEMAFRCEELTTKLRIQKEHLAAAFSSLDSNQQVEETIEREREEFETWQTAQCVLLTDRENEVESLFRRLEQLESDHRRRENDIAEFFDECCETIEAKKQELVDEREFSQTLALSESKKLSDHEDKLKTIELQIEQTRIDNDSAHQEAKEQFELEKARCAKEFHQLQHDREMLVSRLVDADQKLKDLNRREAGLEEFKSQLDRMESRLQKEQDAFLDKQRRVVEDARRVESAMLGRDDPRAGSDNLIGSTEFLNILDQAMKKTGD